MDQPPDDEPTDVQAIMEEIRRQVRKEFYEEYDEASLEEDLRGLSDNCNVANQRVIVSHRRWLGALFVWVRKMLYAEVRRSVDPALAKQSAWNRMAARILLKQDEEIRRLRHLLGERQDEGLKPSPATDDGPESPDGGDADGPEASDS